MNKNLILLALVAVGGAVIYTRFFRGGRGSVVDQTPAPPPQVVIPKPGSKAPSGSSRKDDVAIGLIGLADNALDLWSSRQARSAPTGG